MKTVITRPCKARNSMNAEPLVGVKDWVIIKKNLNQIHFMRDGVDTHGNKGWKITHHRGRDK
jgi:hypothetical protein